MKPSVFSQQLLAINACPKFTEWVANKEFEEAWVYCPSGFWLLQLAQRLGLVQFWEGCDFSVNKVRDMLSMDAIAEKLSHFKV